MKTSSSSSRSSFAGLLSVLCMELHFCCAQSAANLSIEIEVRWGSAGTEPRAAIESEVLNCPLDENQNTILECDYVRQVYERPHQPGCQSRNMEAKDCSHRGRAPNHRQRATVE